MKTVFVLALLGAFGLGFVFNDQLIDQDNDKQKQEKPLTLGAFSVSLNVKDLEKSKKQTKTRETTHFGCFFG